MPLQPKILPRAELLKQRAAVPPVAEKLQESLDRLFVKILSTSTLDFVKCIKCWWKEFAKTQPEGTVPEEINRDAKMPPLPVFLAFVQYQALSTRGRIAEYAVKDTIKSQLLSLFAIWRCEALQPPPSVYRQQVFAYIDSAELQAIAPLCTDARPKFTLTAVDFEILVRAFFLDRGFRTVHMSVQMAYIITIQSLMTERPGALVEGSKHRNTNRALLWNEHEWHVEPNPEDPHHPIVFKCNIFRGDLG